MTHQDTFVFRGMFSASLITTKHVANHHGKPPRIMLVKHMHSASSWWFGWWSQEYNAVEKQKVIDRKLRNLEHRKDWAVRQAPCGVSTDHGSEPTHQPR